jgi:hypothetical protein
MRKLLFAIIPLVLFSCNSPQESATQQIGERFFETMSKRKEIDKMLSFYSNVFQYENVSFESESNDSRFLYEEIYGWKDPKFIYESAETLQVEQILSNDSTIIGKGVTMPYVYNGREVEGTRFVIVLELDKEKKIVKQTDWYNYPMMEVIEAFHLKNSMKIE